MQKQKAALSVAVDFQFGGKEWLIDGTFQPYSLNGRFFSANLRFGARYGITDRLEIGGRFAITHLSYEADEFLIPSGSADIPDTIVSFDRRQTGPGDAAIYARYRFTPPGRIAASAEVEAKFPTGYQAPEGTFIDDDPDAGVRDDVALGDGQLDITPTIHLGFVPLNPWFLRLGVGFRIRFFGPGQQIVGQFKTGVKLGKHLLLYGGVDAEHTITKGKVIGQTFVTANTEAAGSELELDDIRTLDLRLDRTAIRPGGGLLVLFKNWEFDVSYRVVAYGRNVGQLQAITVGVTVRP